MDDEPDRAVLRDRAVLLAALTAVIVISLLSTLSGAGMSMSAIDMTRMGRTPGVHALGLGSGMFTMPSPSWTLAYGFAVLAMWWTMMLAMMLPSATPMILQYAAISRLRRDRNSIRLSPYVFAIGYGLAWGSFSLAAVLLQWQLSEARLLSPMMLTATRWLAAALLIGAGIWQVSALKLHCLALCRSPIEFLVRHRHQGALRLGLTHGVYCLGCCWALMLLLFYGGVMNLYWIIGLSVLVLTEKLTAAGPWLARVTGAGLIAWGTAMALALV